MVKRIAFQIAALAVAVPALVIATPAQAQDVRVDPEHIMTVLKDAGYPAEAYNHDKGYRQILSKTGDYQFLVEMYDCEDGKNCETLEFYSNFPMEDKPTKEQLDAYAGPREGTRIALDRRGEPTIRQELDLGDSGLTDEQFIDHVKTWETIVAGFTAYLRQPAGPSAAAAAAPAPTPATS
jgi:hypothetical protein